MNPPLTSIKVDRELIVRVCGVGYVNNATSARAIIQTKRRTHSPQKRCIHSLTHRLIVTYLIPFHKSTASLQTLGHAHRLELKRMNARLSSSHSSFNIYTQNSCGEKKIKSLSFFSGKKPKRSAQDDSETVLVNGSASLRTRMVI